MIYWKCSKHIPCIFSLKYTVPLTDFSKLANNEDDSLINKGSKRILAKAEALGIK